MTKKKKTRALSTQCPTFWTEGAIDAIALESPIRFRLIPASAFLFSEATKNRILFVADVLPDGKALQDNHQQEMKRLIAANAKVVEGFKNNAGKECIWFSASDASKSLFSNELLLLAKNARCNVRVGVTEGEFLPGTKGLDGKPPFVVSKLLFV